MSAWTEPATIAAWVQVIASIALVGFTLWFQAARESAQRKKLRRAFLLALRTDARDLSYAFSRLLLCAMKRDFDGLLVNVEGIHAVGLAAKAKENHAIAAAAALEAEEISNLLTAWTNLDTVVTFSTEERIARVRDKESECERFWKEIDRAVDGGVETSVLIDALCREAEGWPEPGTVSEMGRGLQKLFAPLTSVLDIASA